MKLTHLNKVPTSCRFEMWLERHGFKEVSDHKTLYFNVGNVVAISVFVPMMEKSVDIKSRFLATHGNIVIWFQKLPI